MPQTKSRAPARKVAAPRKKAAAPGKAAVKSRGSARSSVARTTELSEDVLKSVESGQRAAIDAVHKFVDTVDKALPALGDRPSRRQEIVDAAMEMADRLVQTQYDFLQKVVHSAGTALTKTDGRN